jgi:hypothetical protein
MVRTLLTVENSFCIMCNFKELRLANNPYFNFCVMCLIASSVPHRANRCFQVIDAIRRKLFSLSSLYITGGHRCISDRTGSVLKNRSFVMQMSARNAFGARYVFDGRSHDRLAQRSSGLPMLLGPSPQGNMRCSVAPSVVGAPAPHAAAPYRASGFVRGHL